MMSLSSLQEKQSFTLTPLCCVFQYHNFPFNQLTSLIPQYQSRFTCALRKILVCLCVYIYVCVYIPSHWVKTVLKIILLLINILVILMPGYILKSGF